MKYEATSSHLNRKIRAEQIEGMTFDNHMHYSFEFFCVTEGKLLCTVEGQEYPLTAGDAVLVLPNQIHSYYTPEYSHAAMFIFAPVYVQEFYKFSRNKEFINPVFRLKLADVAHPPATEDVFAWKSLLYHICAEAYRQCPMKKAEKKNNALIEKIVDYVYNHPEEKLSLAQLATQLGYSYHYLSNCIKANFGMNFCTLVNNYRIDLAATLLRTTDLSVTQVAVKSGFSTIRSFNRAFQQIHGVTPSAFAAGK